MNIPNTMMRNANSRRGGIRSDAGFIMEGDAVVASAMINSERAPDFRRGAEKNYCGLTVPGASRSASLSASAAPSRVSTVV